MAAIGGVGTVVLIAMGNPHAAGGNARGYVFFWALAITARYFTRGRGGVRTTATVFAVLEGFVAFGSVAFNSSSGNADTESGYTIVRMSPGPFGLIAVIAIIVLLYSGSARQWFKRPAEASGAPAEQPNYPVAQGQSQLEQTRPAAAPSAPGADGIQCAVCGASPAARVDFRGHRGMVILMQFRRTPGPFCRDCGLATYREMTADSALFGWWGILSFVVNPATMLLNLPARAQVAALAPPAPGGVRPPRDPGKPLLRRPAALGLLVPVVLVVSVVAGVALGKTGGSGEVSAGDCVGTRDGKSIDSPRVELVTMDCSDPAAQAKVLARLEGTNNTFLCREYPDYNDAYVNSDDTRYYVLCLRAFS
ncbi:hypothetical protein GCM10027089_48920 [Nocardia thraciensis]